MPRHAFSIDKEDYLEFLCFLNSEGGIEHDNLPEPISYQGQLMQEVEMSDSFAQIVANYMPCTWLTSPHDKC